MGLFSLITYVSLALLAYHYAGYPLLIVFWSRLWPAHLAETAEENWPSVSLIIAAYNETAVITQKLTNSLQLTYPKDKLEIIVVTDGSDDNTPTLVRQFTGQGIQLLHHPERRGKSAAINRAVQISQGDILVFSDANAFYFEDALQKLAGHFQEASVGGVSGNKTVKSIEAGVGQSSGLYWRYESAIKTWESRVGTTVAVVGEMMAIRRDLFTPIPTAVINDDAYLATHILRQRKRVLYEPEAVCWETASQSTADELIRRRRINAGRYQLLFKPAWWPWRYPLAMFQLVSHKFLRLLLPFLMAAALVSNLLAWLREQNGRFLIKLLFLGQLAFYGLAALGWLAEKIQKPAKLPAAVYYLVSGSLTSVQGLWRLLSGRQSVLWEKAKRE